MPARTFQCKSTGSITPIQLFVGTDEGQLRNASESCPEAWYQFELRTFLSGFGGCPFLQFFPEGIPAAGQEFFGIPMLVLHENSARCGDFSNRSEKDALKPFRQKPGRARGHGEKQFVVFSPMQREFERVAGMFLRGTPHPDLRDLGGLQKRSDPACSTESGQIAGQAIGEIHHSGGNFLLR
jgi:hypothetical protein